MAGFGREPARGCMEQVSLPMALTPIRATQQREAWISAVQTVSNKHSMLVPCLVKPGRCVNVRGGLPGLAVLLYLPWDPGMLVPGPPLQEQEHVG